MYIRNQRNDEDEEKFSYKNFRLIYNEHLLYYDK